MQKEIYLPLNKCENLIEDADILLFQHPKSILSFGWWVGKITCSKYSHVGLAEKTDKGIQVLEYREFRNSRSYPLVKYIVEGKVIDVFRVSQTLSLAYLDTPPIINGHKPQIKYENLWFLPSIRKRIVNEAKNLLGKPYGYINLIKILFTLIPFIRWFTHKNDIKQTPKHLVCSTLVEFCYRKHWIELNSEINDSFVTPADISNSSVLCYLFSINEL